MILLLEGPDGAGKSTLAAEFVKRGWRVAYHDDPPLPGEDKFEKYTNILLSIKPGEDVILDRFAPSEYVYGDICHRGSQISVEKLRLINRLLFSKGALAIFCLPSFETTEANWAARRKDELVQSSDRLFLIWKMYETLFKFEFANLNAIIYDYTKGPSISMAFPTKLPIHLLPRSLPEGVIGSPEAKFLFVGEQSAEARDLAFYSDERSAGFLNSTLVEAGYAEWQLAFTNALTHDGKKRNLHDIYDGRIVIALGRIAQRTCLHQAVPFLPAPHPQFVRRFRSKRVKDYVRLLEMYHGA